MNRMILRPCYNRPAMLKLSLELQEKAEGVQDYLTVFCVDDSEENEKNLEVIDDYRFSKKIIKRKEHFGLTKNILEGLKYCFEESKADYVTVIEDDCVISNDYLKYIEYCSTHFYDDDVFAICSINYIINSLKEDKTKVRKVAWFYPLSYTIKKEVYDKYISPHVGKKQYYDDPISYLNTHFSEYQGRFYDVAGLFQRIRAHFDLECIIPYVIRVNHIGVYGRNQGDSEFKELSFEEQYKILKSSYKSHNKLIKLTNNRYSNNFWDFNSNLLPFSYLVMI